MTTTAAQALEVLEKAAPCYCGAFTAQHFATLRQHIESTAAELEAMRKDAAEADQCTELAQALEQRRALAIAETVQALPVGGKDEMQPSPFHAGYQLACEEIIHRLRTEVWDLCLRPVDAPPPNSGEGGR